MRTFLLTIITLSACALSACSSADGQITASPNPVPYGEDNGVTTITWRMKNPNAQGVKVTVSGDDGKESGFAPGASGSVKAPWITQNETFTFRLYEGDRLVDSVTVVRDKKIDRGWLYYLAWLVPLFLFVASFIVIKKGHYLRIAGAILSLILASIPLFTVPALALATQPAPDAQEYADAARQMASGNGYRTRVVIDPISGYVTRGVEGELRPPRFPPGYSLALTPFAFFGKYPVNVKFGARLYVLLYVVAAFVAAWLLGGELAAALTVFFISVSPFAPVWSTLVLSDAFAAGLAVLMAALLKKQKIASGVLAGALVAVRFTMILNIVAGFLVLKEGRKKFLIASAAPLLALAAFQWREYGSPLKTGYLPGSRPFSIRDAWGGHLAEGPWFLGDVLKGKLLAWAVCPCPRGGVETVLTNATYYPLLLLGFFWIFAPPFVTALGLYFAWKYRNEIYARFTFVVIGLSLLLFTFFHFQAARFMAAPATLLVVMACVGLARLSEKASPLILPFYDTIGARLMRIKLR